ncbi:MAG: nucleotidyltransferase domain-containing protein [Nanoarchaeota archaeon]|nr:nucleotidyltransferase domain-containing protein [Nanoarchaeota archaeon]
MKSKDVQVIQFLIENMNVELNIRDISKSMKIDYKNVHSIVKRLEKESLVRLESFGNSRRIKLILNLHPLIFEAEYNRKKDFLKSKDMEVMLDDFKRAIKSKYYVLLLFGSFAKNTQSKKSDIDLMFIVPAGKEEIFEKDIRRVVRSLPLPIHPSVFSEIQFYDMKDSKEPNVVHEAIKNNIILYGTETYYELMS